MHHEAVHEAASVAEDAAAVHRDDGEGICLIAWRRGEGRDTRVASCESAAIVSTQGGEFLVCHTLTCNDHREN